MTELHVELILGKRIVDSEGRVAGRIEEIRAEDRNGETIVTEYHLGSYAVLERLSAWTIGRSVLRFLSPGRAVRSYRVPWDLVDWSDADRPRLTCRTKDLKRLG